MSLAIHREVLQLEVVSVGRSKCHVSSWSARGGHCKRS